MKEIDIKQKNVCNDIELRSEKVRNLLGEIPPALVRWGSVIIVAIFLVLLLVGLLQLFGLILISFMNMDLKKM